MQIIVAPALQLIYKRHEHNLLKVYLRNLSSQIEPTMQRVVSIWPQSAWEICFLARSPRHPVQEKRQEPFSHDSGRNVARNNTAVSYIRSAAKLHINLQCKTNIK